MLLKFLDIALKIVWAAIPLIDIGFQIWNAEQVNSVPFDFSGGVVYQPEPDPELVSFCSKKSQDSSDCVRSKNIFS